MSRRVHQIWAVLTSLMIAIPGCAPQQPYFIGEDGDLSHYVDVATSIDYPDACTETLEEVTGAEEPLTLENATAREMWDLCLEEAVKISMSNSRVMRTLGGRLASTPQGQPTVGGAPETLLNSRGSTGAFAQVQTVYDPAIQDSAPFGLLTGGTPGVEGALSLFDAQFTTQLIWQKNDRPQNVAPQQNVTRFFTPSFQQDNATFGAEISKITATGARFAIRNNTFYDQNNNPTREVPSDWNTNFEVEGAIPLLAGAGAQFNRIAGPLFNFSAAPLSGTLNNNQSVNFRGVMLARINTDISLASFEAGVRNMVADVENAYWDLYFDYRNLEATKAGRNSALQTWKKIHALFVVGAKGGEAEKEAQAREQYFFFRGQVQSALNNLFRDENRLRYLMGLAASDGRLVRPTDEPTTAHVAFNWNDIHTEGLARSVELRQQKWRVKARELELIAAKNLLLPRLDVLGRYRWLGLGDDLLDSDRDPTHPGSLVGTNAFQQLTTGNFQEWQTGIQMSVPIGFRNQLTAVRNSQLQCARDRSVLQDMELEVSHQLADAVRSLDGNYNITQTQFNRRVAAERQVEAVQAAFDAETVTLDLLLDAQRRRADAEIAYYRALVDYNRGIVQVHFRKGSLLEYNGVYLQEGPWPAKAQFDAYRLARQRDASIYLDYGYTRPKVISQGAYLQHRDDGMQYGEGMQGEMMEGPSGGQPTIAPPEEVPAPSNELPASPEGPMGRRKGPTEVTAPNRSPLSGPILKQARVLPSAPKFGGQSLLSRSGSKFNQGQQASNAPEGPQMVAAQAASVEGSENPAENVKRAGSNGDLGPAKRAVQWKSARNEASSTETAGATDRTAAGWQRAQR